MKILSRVYEWLGAPLFVLLITLCLMFGMAPAYAQTTPSVTFGASVTNANGSLSTTLTWATTPAAQSCTASGHTNWTGTKAASGSLALPAITLSGTYSLTLNCTWPGDTSATVNWTAPTLNTDGSALAKCATADTPGPCLAEWHVYRAATPAGIGSGEMTPVRNPNALSYVWPGLTAGVHCFAVEAVNGDGTPSAMSNVTNPCKTITGTTTRNAGVTLTVNPKPAPPSNVTVN